MGRSVEIAKNAEQLPLLLKSAQQMLRNNSAHAVLQN